MLNTLFAFAILFGVYFLGAKLIGTLWKSVKSIHWTKFRRKDLVPTLVVIAAIVGAEFLVPSLHQFGRPDIQLVDQNQLVREQIRWPEDSLSYDSFGKLAPWLNELTHFADEERARKIENHHAELEKFRSMLERTSAQKRDASKALKAFRRDHANDNSKETLRQAASLQLKLSEVQEEHERIYEDYSALNKSSHKIAEYSYLFDPVKTMPIFEGPINVLYASAVEHVPNRKHDQVKTPRQLADSPYVIRGRTVTSFGERLSIVSKEAIRTLKGTQRPDVAAKRIVSCDVALRSDDDGKTEARRFCDASVPIYINYDLTNQDCRPLDTGARANGGSSEFVASSYCLERWMFPPLKIRIFEDHLEVFEPIALSRDYGLRADNSNSKWDLELNGERIPLDGRTKIDLPSNIAELDYLTISHMPADKDVRVWNDADTDLPWLGSKDDALSGVGSEMKHLFSERKYQIKIRQEMNLARQFLELVPPLPVSRKTEFLAGFNPRYELAVKLRAFEGYSHVSADLDRMASSLSKLGTLSEFGCLGTSAANRPSQGRIDDMFEEFPRFRELTLRGGNITDCKKLLAVRAIVQNFQVYFSSKEH